MRIAVARRRSCEVTSFPSSSFAIAKPTRLAEPCCTRGSTGFRHEQITGPYLCANCDNMVFSQWENDFSRHVFADSMAATHHGALRNAEVPRIACFSFRPAQPPRRSNCCQPGTKWPVPGPWAGGSSRSCSVREPAIRLSVCFPPDHRHMHLLPGVNYFLTTGFHSRRCVHRAEGPLPNCMMVLLPSILLLYSEADLTQTIDPDFAGYVNLRPRGCLQPGYVKHGDAGILRDFHRSGDQRDDGPSEGVRLVAEVGKPGPIGGCFPREWCIKPGHGTLDCEIGSTRTAR